MRSVSLLPAVLTVGLLAACGSSAPTGSADGGTTSTVAPMTVPTASTTLAPPAPAVDLENGATSTSCAEGVLRTRAVPSAPSFPRGSVATFYVLVTAAVDCDEMPSGVFAPLAVVLGTDGREITSRRARSAGAVVAAHLHFTAGREVLVGTETWDGHAFPDAATGETPDTEPAGRFLVQAQYPGATAADPVPFELA